MNTIQPLTNLDALINLLSDESEKINMRGKVKTREKCSKCGNKFRILHGIGILCPECKTRPKTYFIFLYHKKNKYRISRDIDGHILDSYKRADNLLDTIRKDIKDGIFSVSDYLPSEQEQFRIKNLLNKWLETKKDFSPSHVKEIKRYIRVYYLLFFGNLHARHIRAHHIEDFYLQLPNHLSLKTKKNIITMLKNFILWLIDREMLLRRPKFPVISPTDPEIKWISKEDQMKALEYLDPYHKPIFEFMMFHPIRPGEVRALKVKDFDPNNRTVHICRAWSLKELRSRKNKKPYYLPLSVRFDTDILKDKLPEAFIFTNKAGRPYTSEGLRRLWHKASGKAGLSHITLYNATRHSIASQAVNQGIDLALVSKALGHSSLEMTKKYASMNTQILKNVIDGAQVVQMKGFKYNKVVERQGKN